MSNAYIDPDSIANINGYIQEYKERIQEEIDKIINGFDELNWITESGNEFRSNLLDGFYNESKDILFVIDDEISPYLNEKYQMASNL